MHPDKLKILLLAVLFAGCLKDNINTPVNVELENAGRLIHYFEEQGDYINSSEAPSLIDAAEVYSNLNNYLIIDVRNRQDYLNGHIENALNIPSNELLNFLSDNTESYAKIVIVSANGQASAYYSTLLRLYGLKNVYTLNFGMAYWNMDFAEEWLKKIKTSPGLVDYNNINNPKGSFTNLPIVIEQKGSIASRAKQRIALLLERGFVDTIDNIDETTIDSIMYFICYGSFDLFYDPSKDGPGHPPGAVFYRENIDLRSTNFLQTLPTEKSILIYDYAGQYSAAVTAYFRVLGYDANSFLFGACQLFYYKMYTFMPDFAFLPGSINNFPYITGSSVVAAK